MPVQVNGNLMPARMATEGSLYLWLPAPVVAKNGRGRAVQAGYPSLRMGWTWLLDSEWNWWVTTILGGNIDAEITGTTQLYDDTKTLKTISSCIVNKPVYQTFRYGIHYGVELLIENIVVSP